VNQTKKNAKSPFELRDRGCVGSNCRAAAGFVVEWGGDAQPSA